MTGNKSYDALGKVKRDQNQYMKECGRGYQIYRHNTQRGNVSGCPLERVSRAGKRTGRPMKARPHWPCPTSYRSTGQCQGRCFGNRHGKWCECEATCEGMRYTEAQKTSVETLSSDQEYQLESNQSIRTPDYRFQVSASWRSAGAG